MFRDVRLVFQRLFRPDKNKESGGSIEYSPSLGFFCGHASDFDVATLHPHLLLFCSVPSRFVFGSAENILSCMCVHSVFGTPATVFPHPFVLCCWS